MMNTRSAATATALIVTAGIAGASWLIAIPLMSGMNMGVETQLGSFSFFIVLWAVMMAAMMLPGATPAVFRHSQISGRIRSVLAFVGSYLFVWTVFGFAVYLLYRPHSFFTAGVIVIAAGVYELTSFKRVFRLRCCENVHSGFKFGLCCMGSSTGLMLIMVALGIMSLVWMSVITVLVLAQKLLPARATIDVPLALLIIGFGILMIIVPSMVTALTPFM